jgi:hypothetical protein
VGAFRFYAGLQLLYFMVQSQHHGADKASQPDSSKLDNELKPAKLGSKVEINKPLRKALAYSRGLVVKECIDGCFAELKKPENREFMVWVGDSLKAWNETAKKIAGVQTISDVPIDERIKLVDRAALALDGIKHRLLSSGATGLKVPISNVFTTEDNHEARWRIIDLVVNAYAISRGYKNINNVGEVMDHFMAPTPGSPSEEVKERIVERAWTEAK